MCKPKAMGGLGLLNTKRMNITLLLKWGWHLFQGEEAIWVKLIRAKYMDANNMFAGSGQRAREDRPSGKACIKSNIISVWVLNLWCMIFSGSTGGLERRP
jgi:hypothetical protein